ncbi:hypothetical protein BC834DRAFT_940 [Gloeopeniophorella convolvens]|nr:hypothetical protein BC834DRAFT_940 [Gloeopeniophorella convolvens]
MSPYRPSAHRRRSLSASASPFPDPHCTNSLWHPPTKRTHSRKDVSRQCDVDYWSRGPNVEKRPRTRFSPRAFDDDLHIQGSPPPLQPIASPAHPMPSTFSLPNNHKELAGSALCSLSTHTSRRQILCQLTKTSRHFTLPPSGNSIRVSSILQKALCNACATGNHLDPTLHARPTASARLSLHMGLLALGAASYRPGHRVRWRLHSRTTISIVMATMC